MKTLILLVGILIGIGTLEAQTQSYHAKANIFNDLVGRWEVMGDQVAGSGLVIADSSNIILTYNGEKKKILQFMLDFSKSPIWFDFTVQDADSVVQVRSLLELVDSTHLKWQLFINEERTEKFTPSKGEFLYLKKSQNSSL